MMDEKAMAAAVAQGVEAGVQKALKDPEGDFTFVPREEHYQHHEFIREVIEFLQDGKKTVMHTFWRALALGILFIFGLGLYYWIKIKTGGA